MPTLMKPMTLFMIALALLGVAILVITKPAHAEEHPDVTVLEEACDEATLLFDNPTDAVVQFELRVDGAPGGVFTLAAGDDGEWVQEFDALIEFRVLPDGPFTVLVESDGCPEPIIEPEPVVNVAVVEEHCGSLDLLFTNESDAVVQFELRGDGSSLGVYTVAAESADEWTEEFSEDSYGGEVVVDYRLLPGGAFAVLAVVDTDCVAEVIEPTPCACPTPTKTPAPTATPIPATPVVIEVPVVVEVERVVEKITNNNTTHIERSDTYIERVVEVPASAPSGQPKITPPQTGTAGLR